MTLKAAREAKGLSQRALAKLAGVPQSHISKIENAGVDLRLSSLTQIARALDLEVTLVPRKCVPAVRSIMRSAEPVSGRKTAASLTKELGRLERVAHKIAQQQSSAKEAAQLQSRIHDLTRLEMPQSYLKSLEKLNSQLNLVFKEPENLKRIVDSLEAVQAMRNALMHSASEELRPINRSAYSLDDNDG
jgi:transcriptional regulator with XRE-family HTH domain